MQFLFIEGVPGTGKSTLAEMICSYACARGMRAHWYLEEMKDHPVHPHALRTVKTRDEFPEHCLSMWQTFFQDSAAQARLQILEGSMFQSTVRFMLERGDRGRIGDYFGAFQSLLQDHDARMIYLRPRDMAHHLDWIASVRGAEWDDKVTAYLERTNYCVRHGLEGGACMSGFWGAYAELCDSLIHRVEMPCLKLETTPGDWDRVMRESLRFTALA